MTATATSEETTEQQHTACYVYGLVPADVEPAPDARGLGDPPATVTLVRQGDIAALVSEIDPTQPLGRPEDLLAHEELLDATVTEVPVLPLRFGAVMSDVDAVAEELLAAHHDAFRDALDALEGRVEYAVKARFDEQVVLREVLSENPQAVELRERIGDQPEDATRDLRIQLGELVTQAVEAKRAEATDELVEAVAPYAEQHVVREPTHERDAAHVALLVETRRADEFRAAVDEVVGRWEGRVDVRLLGPLAAYDFVGQVRPGG
jgi:hypothetical protein